MRFLGSHPTGFSLPNAGLLSPALATWQINNKNLPRDYREKIKVYKFFFNLGHLGGVAGFGSHMHLLVFACVDEEQLLLQRLGFWLW